MMTNRIREHFRLDKESLRLLLEGVHSREPVSGLTHAFYRYPACFSPQFARAAIQTFTDPGDLVLDPFMGGGTTLVEARALGRTAIGLDINSLSCFIAKAKTTPLSDADIVAVQVWVQKTIRALNMQRPVKRAREWLESGYQRNVSTSRTWPIRKSLEIALDRIPLLRSASREAFARAILLRTAQWALDCRSDVPTAAQFRERMAALLEEMIEGAKSYRDAALGKDHKSVTDDPCHATVILNRSAEGIEQESLMAVYGPPKLVLTSPPYPGVHVVYHRWQVLGRKETPAPFWIADSLDGNGLSYYTFGDRKYPHLKTYFDAARAAFSSLARIASPDTVFIQMLAFSDASWQLHEYLETLRSAGLVELRVSGIGNSEDGRLWRTVPHRKWYADQGGRGGASREVVLFHRRCH